jgi:hypothetical protein
LQESKYILNVIGSSICHNSKDSRKRKRPKNSLPARLDDLDLNNEFFSSTQAMQADDALSGSPRKAHKRSRTRLREPLGRPARNGVARPLSSPPGLLRSSQVVRHCSMPGAQLNPDKDEELSSPRMATRGHNSEAAAQISAPPALDAEPAGASASKQSTEAATQKTRAAVRSDSLGTSTNSEVATPRQAEEVRQANLHWGLVSPNRSARCPRAIAALPSHLENSFAFPVAEVAGTSREHADRQQRNLGRSAASFPGSAAERARGRARSMGVDRDVMFDRLVTRAGMQMPIVRTIAKDLVHGTACAPWISCALPLPIPILSVARNSGKILYL